MRTIHSPNLILTLSSNINIVVDVSEAEKLLSLELLIKSIRERIQLLFCKRISLILRSHKCLETLDNIWVRYSTIIPLLYTIIE